MTATPWREARGVPTNGVGSSTTAHLNLTRSLAEVWGVKEPPVAKPSLAPYRAVKSLPAAKVLTQGAEMSYHGELTAQHEARRTRLNGTNLLDPVMLLPHSVPVNLLTSPHWKVLLKLVAVKHGMHTRDILSDSRNASIVAARFEAMHLIRTHMSKSYPTIGRLFNRDHTSVLHAVRVVERQRDSAKSGRIFVVDGQRGKPQ